MRLCTIPLSRHKIGVDIEGSSRVPGTCGWSLWGTIMAMAGEGVWRVVISVAKGVGSWVAGLLGVSAALRVSCPGRSWGGGVHGRPAGMLCGPECV